MSRPIRQRVLQNILRAHTAVTRRIAQFGKFLEGVSLAALSDDQLQSLTGIAYAQHTDNRPPRTGLFTWEQPWFDADLPAAPATILVGGVGAGRELCYFRDDDYHIIAFDPVRTEIERARLRFPQHQFLCGDYAELAAENSSFRRQIEDLGPFDAVLLGWGSFTHTRDQPQRLSILTALKTLCPNGPILTSIWMRGRQKNRRSRAFQWGTQLVDVLGLTMRTIGPGDTVMGHAGFGHSFTPAEIGDLAERSGYLITREWNGIGFPHFTLRPAGSNRVNDAQ